MPKMKKLCSYIQADCTPEGAWELVLLIELGQQFNLVRHAGYNEFRIIYDMEEFFSGKYLGKEGYDYDYFNVDRLSNDERKELLSWNVTPQVTIEGDVAFVDYCSFSPFSAFYRVQAGFQFKPELKQLETIVTKKIEYNCGVIF